MKPEARSKYAAAVTLSKGKMYEYGVPQNDHLKLPEGVDLEMQFPLAIGTIGDFAAETSERLLGFPASTQTSIADVVFSAQVLQAFDDSLLNGALSGQLRLLAAAGYYFGDVPGNAAVQISKIDISELQNDPSAVSVKIAMDRPWMQSAEFRGGALATRVLAALGDHFKHGAAGDEHTKSSLSLRNWAYSSATFHELLMADLLTSVSATRIANSAWTLLPDFSDVEVEKWRPYLSRANSIKEMWPSQRLLGAAGLYKGISGVVQMPTSAGKSRATELIIRSSFLSTRTKLALIIAPFRALCQEIAADLNRAFRDDGYEVNQLTDALQADIDIEIFGIKIASKPQVVVLTPEKLFYLLRQQPEIVQNAGLVVYDEGHQFDTGTRGVTYELLLTSIKRLLPQSAQSVLISAVIENAPAVAAWLLDDQEKVVSDKSLQARRLIAFASLPAGVHGQLQFNVTTESDQKFFVPHVIVKEKQPSLPRERTDRFFPTSESGSIALYLGLKLLDKGGVAIYAGKKTSASKIVRDAVKEVFGRGISLAAPSAASNSDEVRRFVTLFERNFGEDGYLTKAAALGIFLHHGNTPQGVRLAIEFAMRKQLIRLIVCTSTLAQGVNLPIRYLLVTSAMQGRESIKVRDFHNLMGRAGRAGMYGEGTVIFTDPRLYDERIAEGQRWDKTLNLISPDSAAATGSTLLSLIEPMRNDTGARVLGTPTPYEYALAMIDSWDAVYDSLGNISPELVKLKFSAASLQEQLKAKKQILEAIESFLMTYRGEVEPKQFKENSSLLAKETLAYSLASDEQRLLLVGIFESVASRLDRIVPDVGVQRRFGRTLLGLDSALTLESWVIDNLDALGQIESAENLFEILWPILTALVPEKRLFDTSPANAIRSLAVNWLGGNSFADLLAELTKIKASYPYGKLKRGFDIDQVVALCEQTFGFEFSLLLAAIKESFIANASEEKSGRFQEFSDILQKRLKYGLPDQSSITYFEVGLSERVIALEISQGIAVKPSTSHEARRQIKDNPEVVALILDQYPSYFQDVVANM